MDRIEENPFCMTFTVEMTGPITRGSTRQAAADLMARDIFQYLKTNDWGFGSARVETCYAWPHPDTTVISK